MTYFVLTVFRCKINVFKSNTFRMLEVYYCHGQHDVRLSAFISRLSKIGLQWDHIWSNQVTV